MRTALIKALKLAFEEKLKERIESATRVALPAGPPGSLAWLVGQDQRATAYVILVVSPRDDRFTVEVAWSLKKRLPDHTGKVPGEDQDEVELRFRLSRLWQPTGFEVWYDLQHEEDYPNSGPYSPSAPEQPCLDRIPAKVMRSLDALEAHGMPYLKRTVRLPI